LASGLYLKNQSVQYILPGVRVHVGPIHTPPDTCPYLPDQHALMEVFIASEVSAAELAMLLEKGWRKFGHQYFRPACPACKKCIPLRVLADKITPSASQLKILNRNRDTEVRIGPLEFRPEIFEVYKDHSLFKFKKASDIDEFIESFYQTSCPSLQAEYYVQGQLAAVGFIDQAENALSSVYFAYRHEFSRKGPGIFSVLKECAFTASLGLAYYYLGYWIADNRSMEYKGRFWPHELYDWTTEKWFMPDLNH
jgi:leucyl-tRNA---protein transferase